MKSARRSAHEAPETGLEPRERSGPRPVPDALRGAVAEAAAPMIAAVAAPEAPATEPDSPERPLKPALKRGWRRRCPSCGTGPMMNGYLTVRHACPVCGEALHHQRADDGPAYLTILLVGHLMGPALLWAFTVFRPDPLILATTFTIGTVALSLFLLPRLKGMMIAFQWAKRMHGFGGQPG